MSDQRTDKNNKTRVLAVFVRAKHREARSAATAALRRKVRIPAGQQSAAMAVPRRKVKTLASQRNAAMAAPRRKVRILAGQQAPLRPSRAARSKHWQPAERRYAAPRRKIRILAGQRSAAMAVCPAQNRPRVTERAQPILSKDARVAALLVLNRVLDGGAYASCRLMKCSKTCA